jgi:predicted PurR-regulated permease PerM
MNNEKVFVSNALEATIRIGLLVLLAAWCFEIVRPFIIPVAWGIIIAVGTYPAFLSLARRLGGRPRLAATLIAVLGLVLLLVPTLLLGGTLIDSVHGLAAGFKEGMIAVPPPPSVKTWPVVGETLDAFWRQASDNLATTLTKFAPQLKAIGGWLLSTAAGAGWGLLQFVIAIVIAGVLLAHAGNASKVAYAIATRLAGEKGVEFAKLAEATVRSVTRGILGVALIQSLLIGLGFLAVGVPGAGLWALLCLILSVIQIGPFPVVLPVLIYVFSTADTVTAVTFLIWSLFAGSIDNILKPILLGRGVQVPMAIIFVGAIGGFVSSGIIGLFVGAVVLVLGYGFFLAWLRHTPISEDPESSAEPATAPMNPRRSDRNCDVI